MKNSISMSKFFEELGCPLKNKRNNWSAASPAKGRALFTIWDDGINGESYLLVPDGSAAWMKRPGGIQLRKDIESAFSGNLEALGVLCHAVDPLVDPRSREYFDEKTLLTLELQRNGERITAAITGEIGVDAATRGAVIAQRSARKDAFDDLEEAPYGAEVPERLRTDGYTYKRNRMVRDHVIRRAKGCCEYCGEEGFLMRGGRPYLEAHHIIGLGDNGPDTVSNVIGLCPKHHREAHFGEKAIELNREFEAIIGSF
jgi:5-methylcytosine-specific restriction protein A